MTAWERLQAMLQTDPRDAMCAETFEQIDAYAEILMRGEDPERVMPAVAIHLATCGPCAEDYTGLLAALRAETGARGPQSPGGT